MATPAPAKTLTLEEAKAALADIEAAFALPENDAKIVAAKAEAGDDLMKNMTIVAPVAMAIQQTVIEKYGFTADQPGVAAFSMAIRAHEGSDADVAAAAGRLKAKFMPKGAGGP
eukprot:GFYU01004965.1.p1 GENE.GFYU01004965.1~~GFYU01004965.1.p1  ORF type:complete len:114 (+),score=45.87 GFYU01004965.1:99-440(+)